MGEEAQRLHLLPALALVGALERAVGVAHRAQVGPGEALLLRVPQRRRDVAQHARARRVVAEQRAGADRLARLRRRHELGGVELAGAAGPVPQPAAGVGEVAAVDVVLVGPVIDLLDVRVAVARRGLPRHAPALDLVAGVRPGLVLVVGPRPDVVVPVAVLRVIALGQPLVGHVEGVQRRRRHRRVVGPVLELQAVHAVLLRVAGNADDQALRLVGRRGRLALLLGVGAGQGLRVVDVAALVEDVLDLIAVRVEPAREFGGQGHQAEAVARQPRFQVPGLGAVRDGYVVQGHAFGIERRVAVRRRDEGLDHLLGLGRGQDLEARHLLRLQPGRHQHEHADHPEGDQAERQRDLEEGEGGWTARVGHGWARAGAGWRRTPSADKVRRFP